MMSLLITSTNPLSKAKLTEKSTPAEMNAITASITKNQWILSKHNTNRSLKIFKQFILPFSSLVLSFTVRGKRISSPRMNCI